MNDSNVLDEKGVLAVWSRIKDTFATKGSVTALSSSVASVSSQVNDLKAWTLSPSAETAEIGTLSVTTVNLGGEEYSSADDIISQVSANATFAGKASRDGNGNTITSTYCNLTGDQTIGGAKTISGSLRLNNLVHLHGYESGNTTRRSIAFIDGYNKICLGDANNALSLRGSSASVETSLSVAGSLSVSSNISATGNMSAGGSISAIGNITANGGVAAGGVADLSISPGYGAQGSVTKVQIGTAEYIPDTEGKVTLTTGWTAVSGQPKLMYRKMGTMVFFKGRTQSIAFPVSSGAVTIGTLPEGYRPQQAFLVTIPDKGEFSLTTAALFEIGISTAGVITAYPKIYSGAAITAATTTDITFDNILFFTD